MTTAPAHILADLRDPSKYVRHRGVAIFDEHSEDYWADPETGEPVPRGTPGARRRVRTFRRKDLQRIAARCNARDRTGSLSPLTLGHTDPDQPDETRQPDIVGYAHGYSVVYRRDLGKWVISTDYYFRKNDYARAQRFPRTSIELWPEEEIIDPIALLKRTPQRDLGQWIYSRQGRLVLRYSKDLSMAENLPDLPGGDDTAGMADQFLKHCFSHPHAKHYMERYGMEEPDGDEDLDLPESDPTDLPDADADADPYGMEAPSATNGSLPGMDDEEEPVLNKRKGKPAKNSKAAQYRRDEQQIRYVRMEREVAQLKARAIEAEARAIVSQLIAEEISLDSAREIAVLAPMNAEQRKNHIAYIRKHYQRTPVGRTGRVWTAEPESKDNEPSPDHHNRALSYMRKRPGMSYDDALKNTKE